MPKSHIVCGVAIGSSQRVSGMSAWVKFLFWAGLVLRVMRNVPAAGRVNWTALPLSTSASDAANRKVLLSTLMTLYVAPLTSPGTGVPPVLVYVTLVLLFKGWPGHVSAEGFSTRAPGR